MAKKKKVVPFNQKKQQPSPLNELLKITKEDLADGADPYLMAPYTLISFFNIKMEQQPDGEFLQFLDGFMPASDYFSQNTQSPQARENYETFFIILNLYFLLTKKTGHKFFNDFVAWAPFSLEEKNDLRKWPQESVFSLFEIKLKGKKVYFHDLFSGKDYLSDMPYDSINTAQKNLFPNQAIRFFGMLPPKHPTGNFYDIQQTLPFDIATDFLADLLENYREKGLLYAQESLFILYKLKLENMLEDNPQEAFNFSADADLFETSFIPLVKMPRETNPAFAKRLLSLDPELADFPYAKPMQKLLSKTLQTFPRLIIPRANAVPLIEAIKLLFTDAERDPEADYYESDDVSHFWTILIETHLQADVEILTAQKVKPDFWQNEAGFSGSFFDEDDYF